MANYPLHLTFELPDELFVIEAHATPTVTGTASTGTASAAALSASTSGSSHDAATTVDSITVHADGATTTAETEGQSP